MALRFYSTMFAADNPTSTEWRIEVWDSSFAGTAEEIELDIGQTLRWSAGGEDRHAPIRGSELKFNFVINSSDQNAFIYDIQSSAEGRFTVRLEVTSLATRYWAGVILPDISSYQDEEKTVYTVTATDGIAALRKIEYRPTLSTFYDGKVSIIEHILNCLNKLPYVTTHWTNTEAFLFTAVDWWEASMTRDNANDPLADAYVDHANYYRFEKGDQKALSCLEVLEDILKAFGCYIRQISGVFIVEQVSYRQGDYTTRNYDYQGNYLSNTPNTDENTIDNTDPASTLRWKFPLNYDYYPGLLKTIVNFDTFQRRNYLVGATIDENNTSFEVYNPLYKATDGTVLRFKMNILHSVKNLSYSGGASTPIYLKFQGSLLVEKVGVDGDYWDRFGYFQQFSYQIVYSPSAAGQWVDDSTPATFDVLGMIGGVPPTGFTTTNVTVLDQDLPPLQLDGNKITLEFDFLEFRDSGNNIIDPTELELHWSVVEIYLGTYTDGVQTTVSDVDEYDSLNDEDQYSEVLETTVTIGTSLDPNTLGAVFVDDAGDFVLGGQWGNGVDAADSALGQLLSEAVLAGQLHPIKKANGTVRGVFTPRRLFRWTSDSVTVDYLFHSGEWALDYNELSGLFHEMEYNDTFSTLPIKRKKKIIINPNGNETGVETYPGGNANNQPGYQVNTNIPQGTVLTPIKDGVLRYQLDAGAQTSIDLYVAANAGQFWEDDIIRLTNPLTGSFEELTVTATTAESDGVLSVTGTTQDNYPPYSIITIARRVGRNHLPIGTANGSLLYYDTTENRYLPTTIGDLLNLVLPVCISDEEAVDSYGVAVGGWYIAAPGHFAIKPGTLTSVTPS